MRLTDEGRGSGRLQGRVIRRIFGSISAVALAVLIADTVTILAELQRQGGCERANPQRQRRPARRPPARRPVLRAGMALRRGELPARRPPRWVRPKQRAS